jgi:hypothetical protein
MGTSVAPLVKSSLVSATSLIALLALDPRSTYATIVITQRPSPLMGRLLTGDPLAAPEPGARGAGDRVTQAGESPSGAANGKTAGTRENIRNGRARIGETLTAAMTVPKPGASPLAVPLAMGAAADAAADPAASPRHYMYAPIRGGMDEGILPGSLTNGVPTRDDAPVAPIGDGVTPLEVVATANAAPRAAISSLASKVHGVREAAGRSVFVGIAGVLGGLAAADTRAPAPVSSATATASFVVPLPPPTAAGITSGGGSQPRASINAPGSQDPEEPVTGDGTYTYRPPGAASPKLAPSRLAPSAFLPGGGSSPGSSLSAGVSPVASPRAASGGGSSAGTGYAFTPIRRSVAASGVSDRAGTMGTETSGTDAAVANGTGMVVPGGPIDGVPADGTPAATAMAELGTLSRHGSRLMVLDGGMAAIDPRDTLAGTASPSIEMFNVAGARTVTVPPAGGRIPAARFDQWVYVPMKRFAPGQANLSGTLLNESE